MQVLFPTFRLHTEIHVGADHASGRKDRAAVGHPQLYPLGARAITVLYACSAQKYHGSRQKAENRTTPTGSPRW